MEWIIGLIAGAVGGHLTAGVLKNYSLGRVGNTIVGLLGGVGGMQALRAFGNQAVDMDIGALIAQIAASGAGGGVLMAIVGLIVKKMR